MKTESREWPIWACVLTTSVVLAVPFLFVLSHPFSAIIGWAIAVGIYIVSVAVFGKGHVLEGAVAAFIVAFMAALLIPKIHGAIEKKRGTANQALHGTADSRADASASVP